MRNYECGKCFEIVQSTSVPESDGCHHQMGNSHEWHDLGEAGPEIYECGQCREKVRSDEKPNAGTCREGGPHAWEEGYILEVEITPTEEEEEEEEADEVSEDDFPDEGQRSENIDVLRGHDTYTIEVAQDDSFDIPAGHEGNISDDIEVNYPQQYLETMTPDEGCLLPGYYHWDGKVVTFKRPLKESDEDWKMDDDD